MDEYIVYIRIDEKNRIVDINSSEFVDSDWGIEIDRGTGDRYHHAQGNYLEGGLYTENGGIRWKYVNGDAVLRKQEEIDADFRDDEEDNDISAEEVALELLLDHEIRLTMLEFASLQ